MNGSQAAANMAAAVNTATRLPDSRPSRGRMRRLMISQQAMPASVAGRRIHTPAVLTVLKWPSSAGYQSKGASVVPKNR
nr:hypothetical protein CPGR_01577 [Mycolicibacter nonchromogenicus]